MPLIARFIVTIEGPGWTEVEDVELPRLPDEGESLETKFGTMRVASAERIRIWRRTPAGSSPGSLSSPQIAAGQHIDERHDREDEKDAPGELLGRRSGRRGR